MKKRFALTCSLRMNFYTFFFILVEHIARTYGYNDVAVKTMFTHTAAMIVMAAVVASVCCHDVVFTVRIFKSTYFIRRKAIRFAEPMRPVSI